MEKERQPRRDVESVVEAVGVEDIIQALNLVRPKRMWQPVTMLTPGYDRNGGTGRKPQQQAQPGGTPDVGNPPTTVSAKRPKIWSVQLMPDAMDDFTMDRILSAYMGGDNEEGDATVPAIEDMERPQKRSSITTAPLKVSIDQPPIIDYENQPKKLKVPRWPWQ